MKKEFINEYILDEEKFLEFQEAFNKTNDNYINVFISLLVINICSIFVFTDKVSLYISIFILLFLLLINIINKNKRVYKRLLLENNNKEIKNKLVLNNKEIIGKVKNNKNIDKYQYEDIKKIIETDNLLILKLNYNFGIIIDKNNIQGGTKEELISCIKEKNKSIKILDKNYFEKINIFNMVYVTIISIIIVYLIAKLLN